MSSCRLEQQDEARRWLDDARDQFKDWPVNSEIVVRMYADAEMLIEKKVSGSAMSHAQHGRWELAASAFLREGELEPSDTMPWLRAASLQLYLGNEGAYRDSCRKLMQLYPTHRTEGLQAREPDNEAFTAERIAKVCSLAPGAVEDFAVVEQLIAQPKPLKSTDDWFAEWFALAKGLVEYRAGHQEAALEWLKRSKPASLGVAGEPSLSARYAAAFAGMALAEHKLGHIDDARRLLSTAQNLANTLKPDFAAHPDANGDAEWAWYNWVHALILIREAEHELALPASSATAH